MGVMKLISGKLLITVVNRHFPKLTEFTAHCQIANDWVCFVKHKLLTPFNLTCQGDPVV